MSRKPNKRHRANIEGGSTHFFIPDCNETYSDVRVTETRVRKSNLHTYTTVAPITVQRSERPWDHVASWTPKDDLDFALEINSGVYDAALEASVMGDDATDRTKKDRSQVSV